MASQFFGLNTAYTGLLAANVGINTTGNNISNVETKGYSRQVVNQQASSALRTYTSYGSMGAGVDVTSVDRVRNDFYDLKSWNNNANVGEYSVKSDYMKQMEDYFKDDKDIAGFTTIFNEMYESLNALKNDAGDDSKTNHFIGSSENLSDYFNGMAGNLEKMQSDLNAEVQISVDTINSLASQIASVNQQINVLEVRGETASELRDLRTLMVDQLSQIVDVEVTETPVYNQGTGGNSNINRFEVKIAGGQSLVDTNEFKTITCVPRETDEKVNQSDIEGLYDLYWSNGSGDFDIETATQFNIYGGNIGGSLKGLVEMRDGNNEEYFNGTISNIGNNSVTIDVTEEYLKSINKVTLPDSGGKINLGNQVFHYDSWECKKDEAGNYSYVFKLSDSTKNPQKLSHDKIGESAVVGASVDAKGVPYYMAQMNEWIRTYSSAFNEILENGVDEDGNPAGKLLLADDLANGGQLTLDADTTMGFSSSDSSYYKLTAKNFAVSDIMKADPGKFPTHTGEETEESKYDILEDLIDLKDNKDKVSFRGASAGEFLECVLTDIALGASHANLFSKNFDNIGMTIESQRLSISGVDKDEEAVNLVKYQNSYTLASKMIQTLTEIYDQLILNTGV